MTRVVFKLQLKLPNLVLCDQGDGVPTEPSHPRTRKTQPPAPGQSAVGQAALATPPSKPWGTDTSECTPASAAMPMAMWGRSGLSLQTPMTPGCPRLAWLLITPSLLPRAAQGPAHNFRGAGRVPVKPRPPALVIADHGCEDRQGACDTGGTGGWTGLRACGGTAVLVLVSAPSGASTAGRGGGGMRGSGIGVQGCSRCWRRVQRGGGPPGSTGAKGLRCRGYRGCRCRLKPIQPRRERRAPVSFPWRERLRGGAGLCCGPPHWGNVAWPSASAPPLEAGLAHRGVSRGAAPPMGARL